MGAVRTAECERARSWVSLSLDGELSEIEQVSLRAHVARCAECAGFERDLGALTRELRAVTLERPAFGAKLRRGGPAVRVLQISAVAAAIVLAAGLGSLAGSLSSPGKRTATTVTTGSDHGAPLDRGIVAMAPGHKLPASRIRTSVAL